MLVGLPLLGAAGIFADDWAGSESGGGGGGGGVPFPHTPATAAAAAAAGHELRSLAAELDGIIRALGAYMERQWAGYTRSYLSGDGDLLDLPAVGWELLARTAAGGGGG